MSKLSSSGEGNHSGEEPSLVPIGDIGDIGDIGGIEGIEEPSFVPSSSSNDSNLNTIETQYFRSVDDVGHSDVAAAIDLQTASDDSDSIIGLPSSIPTPPPAPTPDSTPIPDPTPDPPSTSPAPVIAVTSTSTYHNVITTPRASKTIVMDKVVFGLGSGTSYDQYIDRTASQANTPTTPVRLYCTCTQLY